MIRRSVKVLACLFVVLISFSLQAIADSSCVDIQNSVPNITVQGNGKVTVKPDLALVMFGVMSDDRLLKDAYEMNTKTMNPIIKEVKSMDIDEKDIKTATYRVQPVYPKNSLGRIIPGKPVSFKVSQDLLVRVRDLDKTGEVIDRVMQIGANTFSGIQFSTTKREEFEKEALAQAAKDAQEEAKLLAKSLDVSLGRILTINKNSSSWPNFGSARSAFALSDSRQAPAIESGSLDVTATCSVTYELIQ